MFKSSFENCNPVQIFIKRRALNLQTFCLHEKCNIRPGNWKSKLAQKNISIAAIYKENLSRIASSKLPPPIYLYSFRNINNNFLDISF